MELAPEDRLDVLQETVAHTAVLLTIAIEGIARTGAFDQAGNRGAIVALLDRVRIGLDRLGIKEVQPFFRGARERVENKPIFIKRLVDRPTPR